MWGVGVWSEVGVLIHPTAVLWDSGQGSGLAIPFLERYCPQDILYGLVVRVPGYGSRGLGSIPGATRFSE
jgi:hypothetical protein